MNDKSSLQSLRERAEAAFASKCILPAEGEPLDPQKLKALLHELQVQQIELEVQNEELRRSQLELEATRQKYFDLFELAPTGYCTINANGFIVDANLAFANLLDVNQSDLIDSPFTKHLIKSDQDTFYLRHQELLRFGYPISYELRFVCGAQGTKWAQLTFRLSENAGPDSEIMIGVIDITARKKIEEDLLARTAFFEAIADSPQDGILVVDRDGNKIHQNARLAELWKIPKDIASDKNDMQQAAYASKRAKSPLAFLERIRFLYANPDLTSNDEIELIDGTVLDRYSAPVRSKSGELFGRVWTFRDITDRKRAEALQMESYSRLRKIASRLPGFVYQFRLRPDGSMCFPYASAGIYDLFGVQPEEVVDDATKVLAKHHPDENDQLNTSILRSAKELTVWQHEFRVIHPDGTLHWFSGNSTPEREEDGGTLWHGYIHDVTTSRRAELELRNAKYWLEEAQSLARSGNWSYDLMMRQYQWSEQLKLFFGFRAFLIEGEESHFDYQTMLNSLEPLDASGLDEDVQKTLSQGTPYSRVVRTRDRECAVRFLRCDGRAQFGSTGEIVGLFGTATDVTAEVEREEELKNARVQADTANRAKSEFLANMSHEIRTPLTAILGFSELLRDEEEDPPNTFRLQTIDTIINAGQHLLAIINDILDLSKIEADRTTIEQIDTSLVDMLCELERLLGPKAERKGLAMVITVTSPTPERIVCDPTRVRQILMNLVGNAVKFTESGTITVEIGTDRRSGRSLLLVDVIDTGPGMTLEQTAKLFVAFGQADSTVTRRHGGTGLGLTISRRLAELMGGNVYIHWTEAGKGTCFRLELPFEPIANSPTMNQILVSSDKAILPAAASMPLDARILLAEDGHENQRLIVFLLKKAGATVDIADNGQIALEMLIKAEQEQRRYDLLLTDMQMPVMDGYVLTATLKQRKYKIPIVAITAHALEEDKQKCLDAGCDDYISKPISKNALLAVCQKWIPRASAQ